MRLRGERGIAGGWAATLLILVGVVAAAIGAAGMFGYGPASIVCLPGVPGCSTGQPSVTLQPIQTSYSGLDGEIQLAGSINNVASLGAGTIFTAEMLLNGAAVSGLPDQQIHVTAPPSGNQSFLEGWTYDFDATGVYTLTGIVTSGANINPLVKTIAAEENLTVYVSTKAPSVGVEASFSENSTQLVACFTDTSNGPAGYTPTTNWSFGDSGKATGTYTCHTYASAGSYTVMMTAAYGSEANSTSRSITVSKSSVPLTITPNFSWSNLALQVVFTDASTVAGGTITGYTWSFGDNTTDGTGANVTHVYNEFGTYHVKETVTAVPTGGGSSQSASVAEVVNVTGGLCGSGDCPRNGTTVSSVPFAVHFNLVSAGLLFSGVGLILAVVVPTSVLLRILLWAVPTALGLLLGLLVGGA